MSDQVFGGKQVESCIFCLVLSYISITSDKNLQFKKKKQVGLSIFTLLFCHLWQRSNLISCQGTQWSIWYVVKKIFIF